VIVLLAQQQHSQTRNTGRIKEFPAALVATKPSLMFADKTPKGKLRTELFDEISLHYYC
jgi:hypothetical protein